MVSSGKQFRSVKLVSSIAVPSTEAYEKRPSGSLVVHSYEDAGKLGGKVSQFNTGCRIVQSFEVSNFDDLIAVGSDNGQVSRFGFLVVD